MTVQTIERVETRRLVCERCRFEHLPELMALLLDPRVAATLWPGPNPPAEEHVRHRLDASIAQWEEHGFGIWALLDRFTGAIVGRGGLQHTTVTGEVEVEVGWAITPARWGQGLATELALASVETGFETLGMSSLIAYTMATNTASVRVMEKAGFSFACELEHVSLPHVLYRRDREAPGSVRTPC